MLWYHTALLWIVCIWSFYRLIRWCLTIRPLDGIPRSKNAHKFLGDIPAITKLYKETGSQIAFFDEMYKEFGSIYQVSLGPKRLLVLNEMSLIQDVALRRTPTDFDRDSLTLGIFDRLVPNGQLSMRSTDAFKAHRKALAPVIGSAQLAATHETVVRSALELVDLWNFKRKMYKGRPFSLKEDIYASLTDTLGRVVLGSPFGCLQAVKDHCTNHGAQQSPNALGAYEDAHAHKPLFYHHAELLNESLGNALGAPFPRQHIILQSQRPSWKRSRRFVWDYLAKRLEEARATVESAKAQQDVKSVLQMLTAKEEQGKLPMNSQEVLDELYILIFGGSDTSATTLSWALKILGRHPTLQRELHDYLKEKLPPLEERLPTAADLSSDRTPLLDAYTYELIRLARATTGGARTAQRDTLVDGHLVPKGSLLLLASSASIFEREPSHPYDEAEARKARGCGYWKDADPSQFNPKRWLTAEGTFDPRAGPFLAFSVGSRGCFGRSVAISQLKAYLAVLSLSFFFDQVPSDLDSRRAVVTVVTKPAMVYGLPRSWDD